MMRLQASFQLHPHHLTLNSPWPILLSGGVLSMLTSFVLWFNYVESSGTLLALGLATTTLGFALWVKDVTTEGTLLGHHTQAVAQCLTLGFGLFVLTEACVFLSVFWAYFHSSLSPTVELGAQWPPLGIEPLSPMAVPLLNTLLLVSSGASVTWAHHAIALRGRGAALLGLAITVILAIIFTALQGYEYVEATFSMADGAFGSCFYASTGTHGLHVLVGTLFLAVGLWRLAAYHFTASHQVGLEAAILYWHFVDVVWLFLYLVAYWWGSV